MILLALEKVEYTDRKTVISAKNMNDMQDSIIALEGGAILNTAQALTDKQKAQARANIGAAAEGETGGSTMTVTITDGVASHTSAEIFAHVQAGGTAALEDGNGFVYPLVGSCADYATFEHSYDDDLRDNIVVYDDGSVEYREYNSIKSGALSNRIPVPSTAEVGQTIVVKSVGDTGKPTAWECVDLPAGADGKDGEDGFSPVATVTQTDSGAVISITDANGTTTATVTNGKNGNDGADGAKGDTGEKGDSGVYILAEGEAIEDAPADATVVVDPYGTADMTVEQIVAATLEVIENGTY